MPKKKTDAHHGLPSSSSFVCVHRYLPTSSSFIIVIYHANIFYRRHPRIILHPPPRIVHRQLGFTFIYTWVSYIKK
ncbi:hypothetical protein ACS0TY_021194 [Phlomoides rotata]